MITLLERIFIKNTMSLHEKREWYGILCGIAGVILNLILFGFKSFAGLISGSVAIMADAVNNLSDAGSSVITLIGFKLAGQKPDSEHPFGHGRIEYLAGFMVSALIIAMGFSLLKESVVKIFHPTELEFSMVIVAILAASILVKAYMAFYNLSVGNKIDSAAVKATAKDSLGDCMATGAVLFATLFSHFQGINLDSYCGCLVSLLIFYAGYSSLKETLDPLLGGMPDEEYIQDLHKRVENYNPYIVGMHDLMIHDYGPGRRVVSLHAEVPANEDLLMLHDIIDNLEKDLGKEFQCVATIHMDPVLVNDSRVNELKKEVTSLVEQIYPGITLHDFRVVFGDTHTNIIFDMVVPFSCTYKEEELKHLAEGFVKENIGEEYFVVVEIDRI